MEIIGIGVDVVDVPRFRRVIARRPALVERVFTEAEQAYGRRHADIAKPLAARFAAKEAAMKAMGVGLWKFPFHDVEVVRQRGGAPRYELSGKAADLAASRGVTGWFLSLTHEESIAVAYAIAVRG